MPIVLQYGANPTALGMAGYMAGKNKYANDQQKVYQAMAMKQAELASQYGMQSQRLAAEDVWQGNRIAAQKQLQQDHFDAQAGQQKDQNQFNLGLHQQEWANQDNWRKNQMQYEAWARNEQIKAAERMNQDRINAKPGLLPDPRLPAPAAPAAPAEQIPMTEPPAWDPLPAPAKAEELKPPEPTMSQKTLRLMKVYNNASNRAVSRRERLQARGLGGY